MTEAVPDFVESAWLVAVIVTTWLEGIAAGAVNMPPAVIVPAVADQFTAVFEVLVTVAVNCCVPDRATFAVGGVTDTLIGCGGAVVTLMFTAPLDRAPLPGFVTTTPKVPAAEKVPVMVMEVELLNFGTHGVPPTVTVEMFSKFAPFSEIITVAFVVAVVGEMDHMTGVGW
jgi:hypothetical protein